MLHAPAGPARSESSKKRSDPAASRQHTATADFVPRIWGNQARLRTRASGSALQRPSRVPMIQRQCACGGTCSSCSEEGPKLRTKLAINEPGDVFEQEADRVAAQVMRMPAPSRQAKSADDNGARSRISHAGAPDILPIVGEVLRSPGQPLDPETRAFMEPRFGRSFAGVRIHTGSHADKATASVQARAFTLGSDLVFAAGQHDPGSAGGKRLLAHELTHVVQQSGANENPVREHHGPPPQAVQRTANGSVLQRETAKAGAPADSPAPNRICHVRAGATKLVTATDKGDKLVELPEGTSVRVEGALVTDSNSLTWAKVVVTKASSLDLVGVRGSIQSSSLIECAEPPACVACSTTAPPYTSQPTTLVCWAAATTMLVNGHEKKSSTIEQVVGRTFGFMDSLRDNKSLPQADFTNFLGQLNITIGPSPPTDPAGWCDLLKKHGPLGVTFPVGNFKHEVIVFAIEKDGTFKDCFVNFHDPQKGGEAASLKFSDFDARVGLTKSPGTVRLFHF